jgi:hypothetical protein
MGKTMACRSRARDSGKKSLERSRISTISSWTEAVLRREKDLERKRQALGVDKHGRRSNGLWKNNPETCCVCAIKDSCLCLLLLSGKSSL